MGDRQLAVMDKTEIVKDYSIRRLSGLAESFQELATTFQVEQQEEKELTLQDGRDRYFKQKGILETRTLLAKQMAEIADIMKETADKTERYEQVSERQFRKVEKVLREEGIALKNMVYIHNEKEKTVLSISVHSIKNKIVTIDELADFLSVILNNRYIALTNNHFFLTNEIITYYLIEEPVYHTMTGAAKAIRETESVSGDNYLIQDNNDGNFYMALSDGIGSGKQADICSNQVLELTEHFLEAEISRKTMISMINGVLHSEGMDKYQATFDLCGIDLFTGKVIFTKAGASVSYIKHGNLVEQISARTFPLGVIMEAEYDETERMIESGDYIIMISDGILDGLAMGVGEAALIEIISNLHSQNPREMANDILQFALMQAKGRIWDDMTVLVAGIWENLR